MILGEEHPETIGSTHALAKMYSEAIQRHEGLQLIKQVMETRKRTLGEEHHVTLFSMHTLYTDDLE